MSNLLKVWLRKNNLTEDPTDYMAVVSGMGSKNLDDIIDEIMKDGTENDRSTIMGIVTRFQQKAIQMVLSGHSVNTGMIYMRPVIKGSFRGKIWNPEQHSIYVAINQGMQLRQEISETRVDFLAEEPDSMEINSLTNKVTGATDGTLTKGRTAELKGTTIKIEGIDPACGISFKNTTTGDIIKLPADAIVINEPSRLLIELPVDIESGEYELILTSQFTKSNILLKSPRSTSFSVPVIIS